MISSNLFKLPYVLLLPVTKQHSVISNIKFDYRSKTSTTLATPVLKKVHWKTYQWRPYWIWVRVLKEFWSSFLLGNLSDAKVLTFVIILLRRSLTRTISVNFNDLTLFEWLSLRGLWTNRILSVHFFTLYIDNGLKIIYNMPYSCKIGKSKLIILAYTKDYMVNFRTPTCLMENLHQLQCFLLQQCMLFNISKTKTKTFRKPICYAGSLTSFSIGRLCLSMWNSANSWVSYSYSQFMREK